MKFSQAAKTTGGSFGIPPEVDPRIQKPEKPPRPADEPAQGQGSASLDEGFDLAQAPGGEAPSEYTEKQRTALSELAEMGVEITGDEWSSVLYKGFLEKELKILDVPDKKTKQLKPFKMTFRTLTAEEHDLADALLAEEVRNTNMTKEGYDNRKQVWHFALALQKVDGRVFCDPLLKPNPDTQKDEVDRTATAKKKRQLVGKMSPSVVSIASTKFWRFKGLIDLLLEDPNQIFLEKP